MPSESVSTPEIAIAEPGKGEQVGASGPPTESSTSPPPKKFAGIIYLIVCTVTGKTYVGQTIRSLQERWWQHLYEARRPGAPTFETPLHRAIRKYGTGNFQTILLEQVQERKDLNAREFYWTHQHNALAPIGYSLRAGGGREQAFSKITLEKMRLSAIEKWNRMSEEQRQEYSEFHRLRQRDPLVIEKKARASTAKWAEPIYRSKQEEIRRSESFRKADSEKRSSEWANQTIYDRHVAGMIAALSRPEVARNRERMTKDPEVKRKRSESLKRFWATKEGRNKMLEARLPGIESRRVAKRLQAR